LCQPEIIIFDEATKSIDSQTDEMIMKMLMNEFKNTTRIVVTHNPAHQKMADQIITLEKGSLVKSV
jgi:ABC-type multidrug transport system fused ATPase/permease subunit